MEGNPSTTSTTNMVPEVDGDQAQARDHLLLEEPCHMQFPAVDELDDLSQKSQELDTIEGDIEAEVMGNMEFQSGTTPTIHSQTQSDGSPTPTLSHKAEEQFVKELESRIASLESVLDQEQESTTNNIVVVTENQPGDEVGIRITKEEESACSTSHNQSHPPHHPGSIMSLSTGSEESSSGGGDDHDEKFVKIKPSGEMESSNSSSSKASSQSGKENLELEEQIHSLQIQLDSVKQSFRHKEEECDRIKLELEARLLEKNVEIGNINEVRDQLKLARRKLKEKEEDYNELMLISGDLVRDLELYFPNSETQTQEDEFLELERSRSSPRLNKIKLLPQAISLLKKANEENSSSLIQTIQSKETQIQELLDELKDLKEQQDDIVGGYQLISANYEKLEADYEQLLQNQSQITTKSSEEAEEIERFKNELITKDEDLTEMELRVEAAEREMEVKDEIILELKQKLEVLNLSVPVPSISNQVESSCQTDEIQIEIGTAKPTENEPSTSNSPQKLSTQCCNLLKSKLTTTQSRIQFLEANIEQLCSTIAQMDLKLNERETELASKNSILDQMNFNYEELQLKLRDLEEEVVNKNFAFEQSTQNMSEYERINSELGQKLEINSSFISQAQNQIVQKTLEFEQLKHEFNQTFEQKDAEIAQLQRSIANQENLVSKLNEKENELSNEKLIVHQLRENLKDLNECVERKFTEINETLEKKDREIQNLLQTYTTYYQTKEVAVAQLNNLIQEKEGIIQSLHENLNSYNEQLKESKNIAHEQKLDLSRKTHILNSLRNENVKLTTLLKESQVSIQELERQIQEEQLIRESEQLSNQQQIIGLAQQQVNLTNQLREGDLKSVELKQDLDGIEQKTKELMDSMEIRNIELEQLLSDKEVIILELEAECSRLRELYSELQIKYGNAIEISSQPIPEAQVFEEIENVPSNPDSLEITARITELETKLSIQNDEKQLLEKKIELLQSKIYEIEESEINSFEERFMLKEWCRELELQNMKYQEELNANGKGGSAVDKKIDTLHTEIMRLISCLEERDKRCEQLTMEITRLLEERDELQLKLSNVLRHNVELNERMTSGDPDSKIEVPIYDKEDLRVKLAQLEESNFRMKIDLRREKEARRLVQEQLLLSHSSRLYRDLNSRTTEARSPTGTSGSLTASPTRNYNPQQFHSPKISTTNPAITSSPTSPESVSTFPTTTDSGHVSPTTI